MNEDWEYLSGFAENCGIYGKGEKRRLVDEETGEIILEYER